MKGPAKRKKLTKDEALAKIQKYCTYQDRAHSEVRYRLIEYQIYGDTLEEIMASLVQDGFLDELRFAMSFARGKFRIKKWGRIKIKLELKKKQVPQYCINKALDQIDNLEYYDTLKKLLEKKKLHLRYKDSFDRRKKLIDYALRKGYEIEIIKEVLEDLD